MIDNTSTSLRSTWIGRLIGICIRRDIGMKQPIGKHGFTGMKKVCPTRLDASPHKPLRDLIA